MAHCLPAFLLWCNLWSISHLSVVLLMFSWGHPACNYVPANDFQHQIWPIRVSEQIFPGTRWENVCNELSKQNPGGIWANCSNVPNWDLQKKKKKRNFILHFFEKIAFLRFKASFFMLSLSLININRAPFLFFVLFGNPIQNLAKKICGEEEMASGEKHFFSSPIVGTTTKKSILWGQKALLREKKRSSRGKNYNYFHMMHVAFPTCYLYSVFLC